MENKMSVLFVCLSIGLALQAVTGTTWATDKELENEKIAVKFEREVERGGYKVVSTQELKGWLDQKQDMLIVDTMPADNFKKQHIPGAVNFEIQRHPELTHMSEKMHADLQKVLGPNHPDVAASLEGYAYLLSMTYREAEAEHMKTCARAIRSTHSAKTAHTAG